MIVCHCKGVSDRSIRKAVREGACSRPQVARACAAGSTCGGCVPVIDEIIDGEARREIARAMAALPEIVAAG